MGLFVSTPAAATLHGVYAIERTPPAVITPIGTGVADIVGQFPWGPAQSLYSPTSSFDRLNRFAPAGMNRLGSGYLSMIQKAWPQLNIVRVTGASGNVAASCIVNKTGPVLLATVNALYTGAAGNSISLQISAASDGNANHTKWVFTVSGASGSSSETFDNVDFTVTPFLVNGQPYTTTNNYLAGAIVQSTTGVPLTGTTTLSSGADGAVVATDYVGTAGNADKGCAVLETDKTCGRFFVDDCGNSLRASVNAGVLAHAIFMGDRIGIINGNSGQSLAAAQTDVATYRSDHVVYVDPWVYEFDDTTGSLQLLPASSFAASVMAQLSPSTSPAWKSPEVVNNMLSGIRKLEADRGTGAGLNTQQGIMTVGSEPNGGFSFEAGVLTIAPQDATRKRITRMQVGIYIAKSFQTSMRPSVDSPNVPQNQQSVVEALDVFLGGLVTNSTTDANHLPHILAYVILNLGTYNSPASLAGGDFILPVDVQTSAGMERIFLSIAFGEQGITVTAT